MQMTPSTHILTEKEAYLKLSALCASSEQCEHNMRRRMQRWTLVADSPEDDAAAKTRVVYRLRTEGFISDARYARAFVHDKFRYNRWGRVRIEQELRMRRIDPAAIAAALEEIPHDDNIQTLRALIEGKRKSVKGKSDYEIRAKLIRFAIGRGFQMDDILKVLGDEDFANTDEY